uniref:Polyribonucleotide nucleotidyltransferase n=1 Tax=Panagrolaimus sp. ES5 TaxID=591445 RepID=A0AC34F1Z2_9BILA
MADHNIQRMSGDSPFRSAADKASSSSFGWGHEAETNYVMFKHQPSNIKKENSQQSNNTTNKKFYNDMLRSKHNAILKRSVACLRRFNQIRSETTSSSVVIGEKEFTFKTGHVARFADAAVVVESGDTAILATVVSKTKDQSSGFDGLPLQVDFRQSAAAVAVTVNVEHLFCRTFILQVNCKPLSLDENADSVVMSVNAASAALAISKIPLKTNVAAVRIGVLDGNIVINPLTEQLRHTSMNLLVSGTKNNRVVMIEMDGKEIEIVVFEEAIRQAFLDIDKMLASIDELQKNAGKQKITYEIPNIEGKEKLNEHIKTVAEEQLIHILMDPTHDKISRDVAINDLRKLISTAFEDDAEISSKFINAAWSSFVKLTLRRLILEQSLRCDGRRLDQFRPIQIEVDVYKKLHGSALFQRGQSQVFGTVTFDSPDSAFHPDSLAQLLDAQQKKSFFLHYEFPGFAINEFSRKEKLNEHIKTVAEEQLIHILMDPTHDKISRDVAINDLRKLISTAFEDDAEISSKFINAAWSSFVKLTLRRLILEQSIRCDGRRLDQFRPIQIEVDVYKKLHGSALFQRGQSQVFGTVTFDSPDSAFHPDSLAQLLDAQQKKSFFLHYEFPGFAINEFSSGRPFNRRELGHGVLAEKSLKHVIPENFPYCVRLACQVLESNGSTSMASACVGSLALFDAGVPIKSHVAGVAIGMVSEAEKETENYRILTDILGIEDFAGDMDFKMAGTKRGFTAMQLDLKTGGLTPKQLIEAVEAGRKGIAHVLGKMNEAIDKPRETFKPTVPIMTTYPLPLHKRSILYRNGGYNVKLIQAETGVKISAEDDSNVSLFAPNPKKLSEAKRMIETMMEEGTSLELDFGAVYKVEIIDIQENGVFVRVKPGTRPLFIANRHLDSRKVNHASALGFEIGQNIHIQYLGRDEANGSHRFSRKLLQAAATRK